MTHAFISVFYLNTLGRNMSVVSEMLLCHFYMSKQKKPSQVSKYILKREIKLHFELVPF
jgi:hypothetical protein